MTPIADPSVSPSPLAGCLRPEVVHDLTDAALLAGLRSLVRRGAEITAAMLLHLAEVDARRLHVREGYPSLFAYCTSALGLSEGSAYKRISAARLVARLPGVLAWVASGRVHLSGLCVLAPHLGPDNADALLVQAAGKSKRDIECQVAALRASEAAASPARAELSPGTVAPGLFDAADAEPARPDPRTTPSVAAVATPVATPPCLVSEPSLPAVSPTAPTPGGDVAPGRVRLVLEVSPGLLGLLTRAQALLGHAIPSGDRSAVLERALGLLIATEEKRRFGVGAQPRTKAAQSSALAPTPARCDKAEERGVASRPAPVPSGAESAGALSSHEPPTHRAARGRRRAHIPAAVRRAVFLRDGGRCTFVGESGHRCDAIHRLELDHCGTPDALGGKASIQNMTLRCRVHNQHTAALIFGAAHVARRVRERRAMGRAAQAPAGE